MKTRILLFISAFITWLLLSWTFEPGNLILAAAVGVFIAFITYGLFSQLNSPNILKMVLRIPWFVYYVFVFIWECVKANIDGALRVCHPDVPINPGIVKVKTELKSDVALTFLANSLTLKPGTMTVDIDKKNGFLYIHWVNVSTQDVSRATEVIVKRFERILQKVFE